TLISRRRRTPPGRRRVAVLPARRPSARRRPEEDGGWETEERMRRFRLPTANGRPMPKHIPERSCVACDTVRPKRHLVRLVRTADGRVEVDPTWRKSGRGAYLCPAQ